jgi:hypothetical protein
MGEVFTFTKTDGSNGVLDLGPVKLHPELVLGVYILPDNYSSAFFVRIVTVNAGFHVSGDSYFERAEAEAELVAVRRAWTAAKSYWTPPSLP